MQVRYRHFLRLAGHRVYFLTLYQKAIQDVHREARRSHGCYWIWFDSAYLLLVVSPQERLIPQRSV